MFKIIKWAYNLGKEQERERLRRVMGESVSQLESEYRLTAEFDDVPVSVLNQIKSSQDFMLAVLNNYISKEDKK